MKEEHPLFATLSKCLRVVHSEAQRYIIRSRNLWALPVTGWPHVDIVDAKIIGNDIIQCDFLAAEGGHDDNLMNTQTQACQHD